MKYIKCLNKSILAGLAISFGGWMYLKIADITGNNVLAAFMFSFGLILICNFDFNLYTGKICYLFDKNEDSYDKRVINLILILIGNLIGTLIFSFFIRLFSKSISSSTFELLDKLVDKKLTYDWYQMIGLGFFCGILVYLAVEGFKKINNNFGKYVVLILSIGGFIIMGFEHSIADMFYYFLSANYSIEVFLSILLCVIGNTIGGLFIPLITKVNDLSH